MKNGLPWQCVSIKNEAAFVQWRIDQAVDVRLFFSGRGYAKTALRSEFPAVTIFCFCGDYVDSGLNGWQLPFP